MKRSALANRIVIIVIGALVLGAIPVSSSTLRTTLAADRTGPKTDGQWTLKMQELYKTLADLLTDVTSDRRFNDRTNRSRIQGEANKLSGLVQDLNKLGMTSKDADPTIQIVAAMLARETKRAALELKRDNRAYARSILRSVPSYCIACHTRNATGPQFAQLPIEPSSSALNPLERGDFFAASRQFDRAQGEFKKIIQDPKAADLNIWDWERAVHQSLAIAVRVKKDPDQAQEVVQMILKTPNAPSFMKEDAKAWKTSLSEWKSEPSHKAQTEEGLYAEAVRLMAKARETQKYPMDRTSDVLYLRTSAAVHDLLQAAPQGVHSNEALLLAGLSYEVLSPLKTENMHEVFYESCVRRAAHTPTAELCYQRLEADLILGYTGSSGTEMPEDVRQRLRELRALSQAPISLQKPIQN